MKPSEARAPHRDKLLAIAAKLGASNLRVFGSLAKANPGKLNHGTPGAGTPKEIVARISGDIAKALALTEVRDKLVAQGFEVSCLNPERMSELMRRDTARWGKSLWEIGLKLD